VSQLLSELDPENVNSLDTIGRKARALMLDIPLPPLIRARILESYNRLCWRQNRICHSAIISRELGLPCIVGTGTATEVLETGMAFTVSCAGGAEGKVYEGLVEYTVEHQLMKEKRPA